MNLVTQIVPRAKFDNDLLADTLTLPPNAQLGTDQPSTVYRARLQGAPSMVILEAVAPDGYSGKIRMIVAIDTDATISGVPLLQRYTRCCITTKKTISLYLHAPPRYQKKSYEPARADFS